MLQKHFDDVHRLHWNTGFGDTSFIFVIVKSLYQRIAHINETEARFEDESIVCSIQRGSISAAKVAKNTISAVSNPAHPEARKA